MFDATHAEILEPRICHGGHEDTAYTVIIYPAGTPAGNWTLKNLQLPEDVQKHPAEAERLGRVLAKHKVRRAYAPDVVPSSGIIIPRLKLESVLELPHGVQLCRKQGEPADGVALSRGEAFVMSGGGCPVLVMCGDNLCIAAHASRDSLLDTHHIKTGQRDPDRPHKSVINAMVSWAARREINPLGPRQTRLRGYATIPAHMFRHSPTNEKFGTLNMQRAEYIDKHWGPNIVNGPDLCMSIEKLVQAQARTAGFGPVTFEEELPEAGPFGYTQHPDEAMRPVRNLVIVHRKS